jgi:hypothetical protein
MADAAIATESAVAAAPSVATAAVGCSSHQSAYLTHLGFPEEDAVPTGTSEGCGRDCVEVQPLPIKATTRQGMTAERRIVTPHSAFG